MVRLFFFVYLFDGTFMLSDKIFWTLCLYVTSREWMSLPGLIERASVFSSERRFDKINHKSLLEVLHNEDFLTEFLQFPWANLNQPAWCFQSESEISFLLLFTKLSLSRAPFALKCSYDEKERQSSAAQSAGLGVHFACCFLLFDSLCLLGSFQSRAVPLCVLILSLSLISWASS